MEYLVTAEEMKFYDSMTINRIGIPSLVLMERAALAVTEEIYRYLDTHHCGKRILVIAGCGNNGADGLAIARMLSKDCCVEVAIAGDPSKATEEWKRQFTILENYPVLTGSKPHRKEYDILVDAVFGVGLTREVNGSYREWIQYINTSGGYKIAVDIPSGIDSDTGQVRGCAVQADLTVCFAFRKRGLAFYPGCSFAGTILIKKIGIDEVAFGMRKPSMFCYTEEASALLPQRAPDGNKGTFGKVLIAAGSVNMAGAAILCAESCIRSGTGMVKVVSPRENRIILQTAVPEALYADHLENEAFGWPDVLTVGPGLGQSKEAEELLEAFITESRLPLVIDADGLNLLSGCPKLRRCLAEQTAEGRKVVLTPHVGELARLTGQTIAEIKEDPVKIGMNLAKELHCIVVCKDARTLICCQDHPVCINLSGDSGMATAGSGDVLTGLIAGLLAQGMDAWEGACIGVYLHGKAGEAAAGRYGSHFVKASDLIETLKECKR